MLHIVSFHTSIYNLKKKTIIPRKYMNLFQIYFGTFFTEGFFVFLKKKKKKKSRLLFGCSLEEYVYTSRIFESSSLAASCDVADWVQILT